MNMRIIKWLVMVMGIILVLAFLAALLSNIIFGYQLRKTLARLQAEGRPVTLAELRPAPIPANQNAAPLFEKASLLLTNKPVPKAIQELSTFNQELSKLEAQNLSRNLGDLPEDKRDTLKRLIEEPDNKRLFAILSEAAHKPKYDAQLKYEKSPSFLGTRQLIGFQALKAETAAYEGDRQKAGQALLDGFRLASLLKQEPSIAQLLMSMAADGILTYSLYRITNGVDLPADTLQSLETELKSHIDDISYIRALDEQGIITALTGYQDYFNGMNRGIWKIPTPIAWFYSKSGLPQRDMNIFMTLQAKIQDQCRMPSDKILESLRRNPIMKHIPAFCPLSPYLLAFSESILSGKVQNETSLQVTRVGLALKRYKLATGAYPDTLADLTPSFLDKLPKDPCNGNNLLYRKEGKGFLLYSVGRDLQDNQGAQFNRKFFFMPYDIAWKAIR
jgi:hypothetical protein